MQLKEPVTIIVTSNKGGSGKTPIAINIATWGLSQEPPLRVLAIDINHTNQDLFQALQHLVMGHEKEYETAFSLKKTGTAYYLPLGETLHLVRSQTFQPLTPEQVLEIITSSAAQFALQHNRTPYQPDLIIIDSSYCFPNFRLELGSKLETNPVVFLNIWSITSPHELRLPKEYRMTISCYKDLFDDQGWDKTNFIHVFSVLEKERSISSEMLRTLGRHRGVYTVPGSDDLAELYRRIAEDKRSTSEGYTFDTVQRRVFSPMLAEIDSLMLEEPGSYSEDVLNARWVERINIFLTENRKFPLNVLPLPHFYPFLRKAVVDMILRDRLDLPMVREMFADFYKWMSIFLTRFVAEHSI
jgi:hypothetical protein